MRVAGKLGRGVEFLIGAGAAALVSLQVSAAWAETAASAAVSGSAQPPALQQVVGSYQVASVSTMSRRHSGRYFIEFRARSAASYGHMYVLYGQVNGRGEIVESEIAGLHPAGDASDCYNCSVVPWTIGHLIFVPSETGPSDGDLEEKYVTARYRVWLSAAEYKDVSAYIEELKANSPLWNALWANCVGFGRNVAAHLGLHVPLFIWLEPKQFVDQLREMNGGPSQEQKPLKDAPNSLKSAAGFRSALPKRVSLPPSRPTAVAVGAAAPTIAPFEAKPAMMKSKANNLMAEKKAESMPAVKPAAENKVEDKKSATEGMNASWVTR
jgi:hypothetical protein